MATHITFAGDTAQHVMRPDCPCGTRVDKAGVIHHAAFPQGGIVPTEAAPTFDDPAGIRPPGDHSYGITRLTSAPAPQRGEAAC